MGVCETYGFVSGRKKTDLKPCPYCGFYKEKKEVKKCV